MVSWELALEPSVQSVKRGRDLVRRALREIDGSCVDTAVVLTDELVANAVLHGLPPIELAIHQDHRWVSVSVSDAGPGLPTLRPARRSAEHGRGLVIVDVLADQWGVEALPTGKRVWFRMKTARAGGSRSSDDPADID